MLLCTWGGDLPYTSKTDMIRVPGSPVCVIVQRSATAYAPILVSG